MKRIHALLLVFFLLSGATAQSQYLVWGEQIRGSSLTTGHLYVNDNFTDRYGNTYLAGQMDGIVDVDPGPGIYTLASLGPAAFISKYDSSGKLLWAKNIISDTNVGNAANICAIALDNAGNIFALGHFYGTADLDPGPGVHNLVAAIGHDIFVLQLDASGNFGGVVQFPGTNSVTPKDIAVDQGGDVYIAGVFGVTADFDPSPAVYNMTAVVGQTNVFFLRLSGSSLKWAKNIPCKVEAYPVFITVGSEENIYLAGSYYGTADFDPGPAVHNITSNGYADMYVAKFNMLGDLMWVHSIGGTSPDECYAIARDKTDNIYATGRFAKTVDFDPGAGVQALASAGFHDAFILKLDGNGAYKWVKQIGGSDEECGMTVTVSDVSVNAVTWFRGVVDLDPGAGSLYMGAPNKQQLGFLNLDMSGNLKWAFEEDNTVCSPGNCGMAEDDAGYIYATDRFHGTIDCDPGPAVYNLSVPGSILSHYILKLKPAAATPSAVVTFDNSNKNYSIYPNPSTGIIHISATTTIRRIVVNDIMGKTIHDLQPAQKEISLMISTPGVYTISLTCGQAVAVEKLIVSEDR